MSSYIINGGKPLKGEVRISGSKNASLPILAGSILNKGITKLYNVPEIEDVKITLKILEYLNCKVKREKNKVIINSKNMKSKPIPEELMRKLRSSVILARKFDFKIFWGNFYLPTEDVILEVDQ